MNRFVLGSERLCVDMLDKMTFILWLKGTNCRLFWGCEYFSSVCADFASVGVSVVSLGSVRPGRVVFRVFGSGDFP